MQEEEEEREWVRRSEPDVAVSDTGEQTSFSQQFLSSPPSILPSAALGPGLQPPTLPVFNPATQSNPELSDS